MLRYFSSIILVLCIFTLPAEQKKLIKNGSFDTKKFWELENGRFIKTKKGSCFVKLEASNNLGVLGQKISLKPGTFFVYYRTAGHKDASVSVISSSMNIAQATSNTSFADSYGVSSGKWEYHVAKIEIKKGQRYLVFYIGVNIEAPLVDPKRFRVIDDVFLSRKAKLEKWPIEWSENANGRAVIVEE